MKTRIFLYFLVAIVAIAWMSLISYFYFGIEIPIIIELIVGSAWGSYSYYIIKKFQDSKKKTPFLIIGSLFIIIIGKITMYYFFNIKTGDIPNVINTILFFSLGNIISMLYSTPMLKKINFGSTKNKKVPDYYIDSEEGIC